MTPRPFMPTSLRRQRPLPWARRLGTGLLWLSAIGSAWAQSFEVAVSPSRYELSGKSQARIGQTLTLHNLGANASDVALRTLDWSYTESGQVSYHEELLEGSCRPWVALERKTLKLPARQAVSFRFQINVPADTPRRECRFMLAVEGIEPAYRALLEGGGLNLSLPVSGRIAVAVYLSVNGAQPELEIKALTVIELDGRRQPVVVVHNRGDAHGRLEGALEAVDATRQAFELQPEGTPILPGQTRTLPLSPRKEPHLPPPQVKMPFEVDGVLEWERGAFKIKATLS